MSGPSPLRSDGRLAGFGPQLGVVAAAALAVRVAFILVVDPTVPRVGDASAYHLLANNLADGHGYIRPFDLQLLDRTRPTAEYPPLFPAFLSVASLLGLRGVVAQRLLMGAVGTATVVAIGLLGRRVGGPVVGVVAAAVAAFYPMLFLSDAVLMAETPFLLLVTLALLLAYWAAAAPSAGRFAALGAVLGASALTRAEGLALAVVLVVPLAASLREQAWTRRVGLAAGAVVAAVALVVPWTVRNAVRLDAFVPISNNVGTAVDGANCDLAYSGDQLGLWRETFSQAGDQARELPQAEGCFEGFDVEAADFDEADAASAHRRAGLEYARDHLGRVPAVMTVRALRTWGVFRPAQQIDFESLEGRPRRWQSVGTWMYWAILPAAVAGTVVLVRRRARVWPLLAPTVVVTATAALTYGQQRFRAAAEPSLVVLAAVALVHLGRRLAARQSPARSTPARS